MSSFDALRLPAPIASAISDRGYTTATAVQAAVLDSALAGRDLLVSAQTGSGKTLAFGALVGEALLARAPEVRSAAPLSLVVAPTRELATQVGRELEWLLAKTGARLGIFTGGTDVRRDLRDLRAGVDVAVGTPGRLVDLLTRKALDLTAVRVLVLDEADEMLDLGFKDDLEALLSGTPTERRTLLFSATLPPDVERLARSYQKDSARVDVRPAGGAGAHADIEYVAHLCNAEDRYAALVNVLVAAGHGKAIIFCRTREAVGRVHQRLTDHGFRAVLMAGDRAQGDRERALESLRSGAARVLVATNVAARGLDLPDVELVIHADLPENAESLTHRSGRTGRAGRKGTSVLIADLRERRKAERLLALARVRVRWTSAPTEAEARAASWSLFSDELREEAKTESTDARAPARRGEADELAGLVDALGAVLPERELLRILLARAVGQLPRALPLAAVPLGPERPRRDGEPARGRRGAAPTGAGMPDWSRLAVFRINLGEEQGVNPSALLPVLCRRGGVTRHEIGAIRIGRDSSTFEVLGDAAEGFARASRTPDPRAPHVRIEAVGSDGAAAPKPARASKPAKAAKAAPPSPPRPREDAAPPAERAAQPPPAEVTEAPPPEAAPQGKRPRTASPEVVTKKARAPWRPTASPARGSSEDAPRPVRAPWQAFEGKPKGTGSPRPYTPGSAARGDGFGPPARGKARPFAPKAAADRSGGWQPPARGGQGPRAWQPGGSARRTDGPAGYGAGAPGGAPKRSAKPFTKRDNSSAGSRPGKPGPKRT